MATACRHPGRGVSALGFRVSGKEQLVAHNARVSVKRGFEQRERGKYEISHTVPGIFNTRLESVLNHEKNVFGCSGVWKRVWIPSQWPRLRNTSAQLVLLHQQ
jgi:hypothetical protein